MIQAIPHLVAFVDRDELLAGQATPFLHAYYGLTIVAYPLFGFSVAALAWLSGRTLTHPVVNILVAIGAVAFGLAPILHVLTEHRGPGPALLGRGSSRALVRHHRDQRLEAYSDSPS